MKIKFKNYSYLLNILFILGLVIFLNKDKFHLPLYEISFHIFFQFIFLYGIYAIIYPYKLLRIIYSFFLSVSLLINLTYGSFLSIGVIMSVFDTSYEETRYFLFSNFGFIILVIIFFYILISTPVKINKRFSLIFFFTGVLYLILPIALNYQSLVSSHYYQYRMASARARGFSKPAALVEYFFYDNIGKRLPIILNIRGITDTIKFFTTEHNTKSTWKNVKSVNSPKLVVIVLGESLRADNLGIYGYKRDTTPLLDHNKDIYAYYNAYAGGGNTWTSVPAMFTISVGRPDLSKSIVNLAKDAGYKVYWLSNQTKLSEWDYSVSAIADQADYSYFSASENPDKIKYDSILIPKFEEILNKIQPNDKTLIFLHCYGSHPIFKNRYPDNFSKFNNHSLLDDYDNTVYYSDYLISKFLKITENHNGRFLYLSDHGLTNPKSDNPLVHDIRIPPHLDSLKVPLITNYNLHIGKSKVINLFYFECIFSKLLSIQADELTHKHCQKLLTDKKVTFYDSNFTEYSLSK